MSLDDFDLIALTGLHASDDGGFDALYQQALTKLLRSHPDGFPATAAGRAAWDQLDGGQRERALNALFYTWFVDDRREQDEALHHQDITAESSYLQGGDLDHLAQAAVSARGAVTVDSAALWRAVKELRLLTHRVGLLRALHTTEPMTDEAMNRLEDDLKRDLYGDEEEGGR
ncbi:hypothetical protein [Actinacidiphila oryziradicis]|uniref:Uncharacterized protein n=1 Tax=Actinacidiphila oryziradicis TaxID=2571141 RepID=A0A4U0T8U1_9ACTN|nr:hypothetical protein [Actinacidiphila oryziradicis]TKA11735.1 hypothetical protein FCI23_10415 [Actinacidiphila oryziradicis]